MAKSNKLIWTGIGFEKPINRLALWGISYNDVQGEIIRPQNGKEWITREIFDAFERLVRNKDSLQYCSSKKKKTKSIPKTHNSEPYERIQAVIINVLEHGFENAGYVARLLADNTYYLQKKNKSLPKNFKEFMLQVCIYFEKKGVAHRYPSDFQYFKTALASVKDEICGI